MNVEFSSVRPITGAYAYFDRAESDLTDSRCVDIWSIWRTHETEWLSDLSNSHAALGAAISVRTRWWWISTSSRLDARPWGQSDLIKSLMYARAVVAWAENQHQGFAAITLIGCPYAVGMYLADFGLNVAVTRSRRIRTNYIRLGFRSIWVTLRTAFQLSRWHMFRKKPALIEAEVLAIYELRQLDSLAVGHLNWYADLFDSFTAGRVAYVTAGAVQPVKRHLDSGNAASKVIVLDCLNLADIVRAIATAGVYVIWVIHAALSDPPCIVGHRRTYRFWRAFLVSQIDIGEVMRAYCTYLCMLKIVGPRTKIAVITHEERGIERAILLACQTVGLKTIGHLFHPQHHLLLALRKLPKSGCPKPDHYTVCGSDYRKMLVEKAGISGESVTVWGSAKAHTQTTSPPKDLEHIGYFRILLVLSHPTELVQFHAWLESEPELAEVAHFFVRRYRTVQSELFDAPFCQLQKKFPTVCEVGGALADNVASVDAVAFCATSAGPEAVNLGRIGIFCELNDFFCINPFFDVAEPWLACNTAEEFRRRIYEVSNMDNVENGRLLARQQDAAQRIFSKIDRSAIAEILTC